ncbi:hypothetical protein SCHPADRAFT_31601 [Schizopora paradoxa]|uniref:Uncharacterized protein n=1 Tax=Schizopora paradoxa TaxID=27342 RepID=A0A0H2S884_9AGAM|nr:hypothetical protein SCHPADRAFT_31601 [Schizopora paradoxa]
MTYKEELFSKESLFVKKIARGLAPPVVMFAGEKARGKNPHLASRSAADKCCTPPLTRLSTNEDHAPPPSSLPRHFARTRACHGLASHSFPIHPSRRRGKISRSCAPPSDHTTLYSKFLAGRGIIIAFTISWRHTTFYPLAHVRRTPERPPPRSKQCRPPRPPQSKTRECLCRRQLAI